MASLMEELITTLEEELKIYQELIPVAEKKTRIIVDNDLEQLQTITAKEQETIDLIHLLENRRQEVITNMGTVLNKPVEALNVKNIIEILDKQPKEQQRLSQVHDNLKKVIQRLMDVNNQNKSLIQQSLEMIEFNMNFVQSTRMSPGNNYTRNASGADISTPGTGMFDARQ